MKRSRLIKLSIALVTIFTLGQLWAKDFYEPNIKIYQDGEELGIVEGRKYATTTFIKSFPTMLEFKTTQIGSPSGVTTVNDHISRSNASQEVYKELNDFEVLSYKVVIDNGPSHEDYEFYTTNKRLAKKEFENIVELYGGEENTSKSGISNEVIINNVEMVSDVSFQRGIYPSEFIYNDEEVVNYIRYGSPDGVERVMVEEGDSLGSLSVDYRTYIEELARLNNLPNNALLTPGEELIVSGLNTPALVKVEEEVTSTEVILYETEYVKDSSVAQGQTNVLRDGENGWKEENVKVVKYNGEIDYDETEVVSTTILSEPVNARVSEGTKYIPPTPTHKFIWPAYGGYISSYYGAYDISRPGGQAHTGIDIARPYNLNIKASDAGQVVYAGYAGARGLTVRISHGSGYVTEYAHLDQIYVSSGQYVQQGQHVGLMGTTGFVTGRHLHFELLVYGVRKNPLEYLR